MKTTIKIIAALTTLGLGSAAQAAILVDFAGTGTNAASAGSDGGNYWTTVANNTATDLRDTSDGLDSGWNLTVTFTGSTVGFGGTGINGDGDAAPFDQSFAIIDGLFARNASYAILTFDGLSANTTYGFRTYTDRASGFKTGLMNTTTGTAGPTNLDLLEDTVTSFSVTSDDSGVIALKWESKGGSNNSVLNAIEVEPVPEPSSAALLGLGGLALIFRRRK